LVAADLKEPVERCLEILQQEYEAFEPRSAPKETRSNSGGGDATPALDSSTHAAVAQTAAPPKELIFSKEVYDVSPTNNGRRRTTTRISMLLFFFFFLARVRRAERSPDCREPHRLRRVIG
jgi:predicted nucleic acid-binding Zn ribbon protein